MGILVATVKFALLGTKKALLLDELPPPPPPLSLFLSLLYTRHATILGNDYDYGVAKLHVLISWQNNIIDSLLFLYRILRFSAQKYLTTWTSLVLQEAAVLIFYCLFLNFQNKYYYFLKVTHLKTPYYSTPYGHGTQFSPKNNMSLLLFFYIEYWRIYYR